MSHTSMARLRSIWPKAASPTRKSLAGGIRNPKDFDILLKKPIVLLDRNEWNRCTTDKTVTNAAYDVTRTSTTDNDPFTEISEIEFKIAVEEHRHLGLPLTEAPLNAEQRASGRDFLKVAILRKERRLQGVSTMAILDEIRLLGLHQITMMTGTRFKFHDFVLNPTTNRTPTPNMFRCRRNGQVRRHTRTTARIQTPGSGTPPCNSIYRGSSCAIWRCYSSQIT